jgi:hypothetical protein
MSVHLESKDLINSQQMEVAVNGPDGATHLILCTGIASLCFANFASFTFLVGPQLSRRQFVGAIASGALSTIWIDDKISNEENARTETELVANLLFINADYDYESTHVKVTAKISSGAAMAKLAITYNVGILAELPIT